LQLSIDNQTFRKILGHYPTGICAITAVANGSAAAMIVGSFSSVSLDPPLVGFFPDRKSSSWPKIQAASRFCVNVLGAHQMDLCRLLATKSETKFETVSFRMSDNGSPILDDVVAWIDCDLHTVSDAGDHYLALGLVKGLQIEQAASPLLFFQGGYGQFTPLELECLDTQTAA
jgi:flavin reductase (DIM6/NTAB) family NADH-FMN oxidoreductase RutF